MSAEIRLHGGTAIDRAAAPDQSDLVKAANAASVLTIGIIQMPQSQRRQVLIDIGGFEWARGVLALNQQAKIGLGARDGLRFSLALHFLLGRAQLVAGNDDVYARAYATLLRGWKETATGDGAVSGWPPNPVTAARKAARKAGRAAGKALEKAQDLLKKGKDAAGDVLEAVFNWTGDVLCKGLKWLLGDMLGGAICEFFATAKSVLVAQATTVVLYLKAIKNLLVNLASGRSLASSMKLFSKDLSPPLVVALYGFPAVALAARAVNISVGDAVRIGVRAADRDSFAAAKFYVSTAQAVFSPSIQSVAGAVSSSREFVAAAAGEIAVKQGLSESKRGNVEQTAKLIITYVVAIANGLADAVPFAQTLTAAAGGADPRVVAAIIEKIKDGFTSFNLRKVSDAVIALASLPKFDAARIKFKALKLTDVVGNATAADIARAIKPEAHAPVFAELMKRGVGKALIDDAVNKALARAGGAAQTGAAGPRVGAGAGRTQASAGRPPSRPQPTAAPPQRQQQRLVSTSSQQQPRATATPPRDARAARRRKTAVYVATGGAAVAVAGTAIYLWRRQRAPRVNQ